MSDVKAAQRLVEKYNQLKSEISKVIVGQHEAVDHVLLSIFVGGHSLLIGVPGLAKTLLVSTVAKTLGLDFKRIQFTPDLMPSDIVGSEILDENRKFQFIKGPVFANVILQERCRQLLEKDGFTVYVNEQVPGNDGGIALGQAWLASLTMKQ